MFDTATATEQFCAAIEAAGLPPPSEVVDDGRIHRFSTNGKARDESGWYVLHSDGVPAGSFGDWRGGYSQTWSSKATGEMTEAERMAHHERVKAMQAERDAEQAHRHQQAAQAAELLLKASTPAPADHPYLTAKRIKPHGLRTDGVNLLVPMRDTAGNLHSLQRIAPDGDKRFQPGGRVKSCYFGIGKLVGSDGPLVVCEGVATGASIHEATGQAVAVAFNAGNLLSVAQALRAKYPGVRIILAADDDAQTPNNPGMTKATEAARAVGGLLAVPDFGVDRPEKATDFNDLHQVAGAGAVVAFINAAAMVSNDPMFPTLGGDGNGEAWSTPQPLPDGLPPVQTFDPDLLPHALRGWVMDIAHRMQCPPDFPAVGAITALSSLIGARAVIAPKARDDWRVVPNLWGLIVGRPAVMKSPALAQTLGPLNRLQANEFDAFKQAHADWELDCKVADMATDANEKKAKQLGKVCTTPA